jgi:CheY-like chemotaxis protein
MDSLSFKTDPLQQLSPVLLAESTITLVTIEEKATLNLDPANNSAPFPDSYQALASKNPRSRKPVRRAGSQTEAEKLRRVVLIVDDVPDVTEMIGLLLKHAGYEVSTADSAKAALQLARKRNFDLIISDIGMPEMNGYELATALRELTDYSRTPMIAVTGYSEYDDRGRAVNAGFDVHLTKPIEPAQLLNLMKELLSRPGTDH